jgi:hypothetical protein
VPLTTLDLSRREFSQRLPFFLPDGRHFLYLSQAVPSAGQKGSNTDTISGLADSKDAGPRAVRSNVLARLAGIEGPRALPATAVVAQPFDAEDLRFTGEPVPVGESVGFYANFGYAFFTASDNGLFAYQSGGAGGLSQLVWFDRKASCRNRRARGDYYRAPLPRQPAGCRVHRRSADRL